MGPIVGGMLACLAQLILAGRPITKKRIDTQVLDSRLDSSALTRRTISRIRLVPQSAKGLKVNRAMLT